MAIRSASLANSRRPILAILLLAIAVRLVAVAYSHAYRIGAERDHWSFGWETGRIARSLVAGHGFSSPMPEPTGPTAFVAPVFPVLVAGIFEILGTYTTASAIGIYALDILLSALTCWALYALCRRIFGFRTAVLAAALFALYPPSIFHATATIWDVTLAGFAMVTLMLCLYSLPPAPTLARVAAVGVFMGFVVLVNPSLATPYPAIVAWLAHRVWRNTLDRWRGFTAAVVLTAACFLIFLPWMIRNALVVGEFTLRSSSGIQLRVGNSEETWRNRLPYTNDYPSNSLAEQKRYQEMGEAAYDRYCTQIAMNFIRANPDKFMDLTLSRISDWWLGTGGAGTWTGNWKLSGVMGILVRLVKALLSAALTLLALAGCFFAWRRRKPVGLLVAVILIYPIPYYFFFVTSRYRFPIEPLLLLLAVFGIVEFASVLRPANRGRLDQGNASGARAVTLRQRLSGGPDALNETAQIAR